MLVFPDIVLLEATEVEERVEGVADVTTTARDIGTTYVA
jgi:hypothetical protein